MKPLLSHVMGARNDNYLGNFKGRLELAVNYNCKNAEKIGVLDEYEVLIVDWNSTSPLREALNLNESARKCVTFLEVTPDIVQKHCQNPVTFNGVTAFNVGARRAQADMVMLTPADILFPPQCMGTFFGMLRGDIPFPANLHHCYLGIPRKLIPWQAAERLTLDKLDRYLLFNATALHLDGHYAHLSAGEGAHVVSKKILNEITGMDERLFKWGWADTQLGRRIAQFAPLLKTTLSGVHVYDLQQKPSVRRTIAENMDIVSLSPVVNGENWGLGNVQIPRKPAVHCPSVCNVHESREPIDELQSIRMGREWINSLSGAWQSMLPKIPFGEALSSGALSMACRARQYHGFRFLLTRFAFDLMVAGWLKKNRNDGVFYLDEILGSTEELHSFFANAFTNGIYTLALNWHSRNAFPLIAILAVIRKMRPENFLFAPARDMNPAQFAAFVDPSIEITGYDHYQGYDVVKSFGYMARVDHQGHYHALTGCMDTAFSRLSEILGLNGPYQCCYFDLSYLAPVRRNLVEQLRPLLADRSSFIVKGSTAELKQLQEELRKESFTVIARLPQTLVLTRHSPSNK